MLLHLKHSAATLTKDSGVPLDVKAVSDDGTFEGYGSIFGNVDSQGEVVEPGAFTAGLVDAKRKGRTVKMLWQHDPMQPIGVWDDLAEDAKGLYVKGRLLKDVSARASEAYGLLKAGALDGLSIGYRTLDAEPDASRPNILRLVKLDLREVSIVTFAANERARVDSVKHILAAGELPTVREFEGALRELGLSKAKAAAIAAAATPHLRGEPEAKASEDMRRFYEALRA
jgi:HK97 family phage prohead protease